MSYTKVSIYADIYDSATKEWIKIRRTNISTPERGYNTLSLVGDGEYRLFDIGLDTPGLFYSITKVYPCGYGPDTMIIPPVCIMHTPIDGTEVIKDSFGQNNRNMVLMSILTNIINHNHPIIWGKSTNIQLKQDENIAPSDFENNNMENGNDIVPIDESQNISVIAWSHFLIALRHLTVDTEPYIRLFFVVE